MVAALVRSSFYGAAIVIRTILVLASICAAWPAEAFTEITVRPEQDGAGPSHIIYLQNDYVAVVDPLDAKILAFKLCGDRRSCADGRDNSSGRIDRSYSVGHRFGRIVRQETQIVLITEDGTRKMTVPRDVTKWPSEFNVEAHNRSDRTLTPRQLERNTNDRLTILPQGTSTKLPIRAIGPSYLASARELESDRDGRRYVLWKEFRFNDSRPFKVNERTIHVDVYVGRFDRDGKLTGIATIPRDKMNRIGFDYVTITPDGSALLLASLGNKKFGISQRGFVNPSQIVVRKYIELRKKRVASASPPPELELRDLVPPEDGPAAQDTTANRNQSAEPATARRPTTSTRQFPEIMNKFRRHPWILSDLHLRNPCEVQVVAGQPIDCADRRLFVRPPQLARLPARAQVGLPYDWGGDDSLEVFDAKLAKGFIAGNIGDTFWTDEKKRVTAGVDCSGLVKNVWGLQSHVETARLERFSSALSQLNQLRVGDIFLLPGKHVVLFRAQLRPDGASLALKVTEASSRCGSVCDSVYEIDFFHGYKLRRRS